MRRWGSRGVAAALAACALAAVATAAGATPRSSAATVPGAPLEVSVSPAVGQLVVSWQPPANRSDAALTYKVHSVPEGRSCTTTSLSCSFSVLDATPWRFSVTATDGAGTGPASALTFPFRHLTILIVAGQSNAMGFESYVVSPESHRNVLATGTVATASRRSLGTWVESGVPNSGLPPVALSTPQVRPGAPSPIFGPEMGLVSRVYGAKRPNLLVVKAAFAGTSLATDWVTTGPLYKSLIAQASSARIWAAQNWWSATIGGVYWVQGETDSEHPAMASSYGVNLRGFLRALRSDLHLSAVTPIVLARTDITGYVGYKRRHHLCAPAVCKEELRGNGQVRDAQLAVALADPNVYLADTLALARYPSISIHLTDLAELTLGEKFAAASIKHLT